MKGDFLQRRLMKQKYGSDLIFYLPLNEKTQNACTDQISGNIIESGPNDTLIWDNTTKMYKYTSDSTLYNYCFKCKTGWNSNTFDENGSYTVVAKCKLSTSTQKYASFIAFKQQDATNFNKSYSSIQCMNLLGQGSTSNTDKYSSDVAIYSNSGSTQGRSYTYNGVEEIRDAMTGWDARYIFDTDPYDGYLYFGANFDNTWQYNITYYLSELMIFNRILSPEEIYEIQSISYIPENLTMTNGTYCLILPYNQTSAEVNYNITVETKTYLGIETFNYSDKTPVRTYTTSGNGSTTWNANTSTTSTITYNKSITYKFYPNKTHTVSINVILQPKPANYNYSIETDEWEKVSLPSTISSTDYDGVWRSVSNYNVNNSFATMWIHIQGYNSFKFYIRSYAESNYDYVMVSNPGYGITNNTSYSDTTQVYAHTRGNQNADTSINGYTEVSFNFALNNYISNSDGSYTIQVIYRKDNSQHTNDDRGYVIIPKNQ